MVFIPTGKELIDPYKLLEDAGLTKGMVTADFGCGTLGHYVFPAAKMVGGEGKVYAIDILKSVLSGITSRIKLESATNVETLWGDLERVNGIKLADGVLDIGMLINNLFLSNQQEVMMKECVRMVRSGGLFILVDWKPGGVSFGSGTENRVSPSDAKLLAEGAGLEYVKDLHPGEQHYGFLYKKP